MADLDFPTKEFTLLVPFQKVDMGSMSQMGEDEETLTIEGFANWYGEDVDTNGEGVACDLAGDAVVPSGIDLSVYKGNPQILWQHDRCCSIGKANKAIRKKQGLFVNATIYKSAMEEADWFRVKSGLVTRFSIGFRTLAGEYKDVNGKNVFFITKSLLLEISIVTIPCSSESAFSIIKALDDGSFTSDYKEPHPTPTEEAIPKTNKEDETTMKLPLKDLLSVEEVAHFKSLGLDAELDTEKEVSTKNYIDNAIAQAVEAVKAELRAEFAKSSEGSAETEVETEAKEETEQVEEETKEEAETEVEAKEEEDTETDDIQIDSLKAAIEELKTLFSVEK